MEEERDGSERKAVCPVCPVCRYACSNRAVGVYGCMFVNAVVLVVLLCTDVNVALVFLYCWLGVVALSSLVWAACCGGYTLDVED